LFIREGGTMRPILEQAHGIRAEELIFPMEGAFGAEGAPPTLAEVSGEAVAAEGSRKK
jgi:hypothetical protein